MCGIAGIYWPGNNNDEHLRKIATKMISTLGHRGPDDNGIEVIKENGIAFAHCRLSIQDLSPLGAQPMTSLSGRYLIIFNGEIYNFHEIRDELKTYGFCFKGGSDTEVMLASFEKWGLEESLNRFAGMFSFAVWDCMKRQLHFCRDRLGEKPLYYGFIDDVCIFASELKALVAFAGKKLSINRNALTLFMRYGYIPAPYTIYNGIFKLIPGTLITIPENFNNNRMIFSEFDGSSDENFIQPKRYWSLKETSKFSSEHDGFDSSKYCDEFERILDNVVREQMIADVPVGAFLSGGIDSTTVVTFMQKISTRPVKTFTIGYNDQNFNEAIYAKNIAEFLGTDHTEVYMSSNDALDLIPQLPSIYDEPHADSSQLPAYLVSKIARQKVTVCLSGDGGDELFAGYNRYLRLAEVWKKLDLLPYPLRKKLSDIILKVQPEKWDKIYQNFGKLFIKGAITDKNIGLKVQKLASILSKQSTSDMYLELISYWNDPGAVVCGGHEPEQMNNNLDFLDFINGFINKALFWDQTYYLPDDNLCKVDRASMAVSLETRLPLLDYRMVEFSWKLPLHMKIRNGESKWILKQILSKYIDRNLWDRPKMGFSVPIAEWLRGPLKEWGSDLLSSTRLKNEGFFNENLVLQRWSEHIQGKRNWNLSLWAVLTFQSWYSNLSSNLKME